MSQGELTDFRKFTNGESFTRSGLSIRENSGVHALERRSSMSGLEITHARLNQQYL
jgi:hypothetical protein